MKKNKKEDFWKYVNIGSKTECWDWVSSCDKDGYGDWRDSPIERKAHRMAYTLMNNGNIASLCVLHKCDNPKCCNPNHLFLGTHQDNVRDKCEKNRQCVGENNGNHKLTKIEVLEIRRLYLTGLYSHTIIGKKFNVARQTVGKIIHNKIWWE